MTDFGWGIYLTQQAAGNRPTEIEALSNEVMRHRPTSCSEWKNCWAENNKIRGRPSRLLHRGSLEGYAPANFRREGEIL
jgi:hypothetical protein